jgi:hypothetical protein
MRTTFEAVLAALLARDSVYPSDVKQKNMVRAEFLRGAATAFALCWRGEESSQWLEAAKGLHDQLESPDRAARPASSVNRHHELTPPHSVISMVYRADRR